MPARRTQERPESPDHRHLTINLAGPRGGATFAWTSLPSEIELRPYSTGALARSGRHDGSEVGVWTLRPH